jgi:O-antigen/teichoic acid export membrane protein
MELGKHLGKGIWGLADKSLPVVYGLAYVLLVIRVLPEEEFGDFVLVQEVFLIISALATAFALQPLLKYAAEEDVDLPHATGAAMLLNIGVVVVPSVLIAAGRDLLAALLNAPGLGPLLLYVPALLLASFLRNFTLILLQSRFRIREVFVVDAFHFLAAPFLIWVVSRMHRFSDATVLLQINLVSLSLSSLVGVLLSRGMLRMTLRPKGEEIRRMWQYGRYALGGMASSTLYAKADIFLLSSFGGPAQVALYNSVKVFTRLYEMVTQVIAMFVLPGVSWLSSKRDDRSLIALVEKSIAFLTIAMIPVFVVFLFLPAPLIETIYRGRYLDGIPLMRVFAFLAFLVPIIGVASNVLMGLGEAKLGFRLSLHLLIASLIAYLTFIPLLGAMGAALAFIVVSLYLAIISTMYLRRFVPITLGGLVRRKSDFWNFVRKQIARATAS